MGHILRQFGAERVDVELAKLASIEQPLDCCLFFFLVEKATPCQGLSLSTKLLLGCC